MTNKKTPWHQEKWFTSPWNFAEEVIKDFSFAKKILLHDITLRDGEQQAGLIFNKDEKVALAEKMAEIGIHRIEAGMPAVSDQDEAAIKEIVKRTRGEGQPEIFAFARCMKEDVIKAADCGVDGVILEIPASEHIVKYAYKWEYEKAIERAIEATLMAKEKGLYTVFFPIDGTRTELETFIKLITSVASHGHMDALAIVDTFGGLAPTACRYLVKKVKEVINKPIEVHFHDDFGMGVANTLMGLTAGADVAHTTITGIGERAGNAAYEDLALALLTMFDIDLGLKYEGFYELSKMMRDFSGHKISDNRGIVGPNLADIESGIVADWFVNAKDVAPLEVSPYLYSLVGHPEARVVIGKNSGIPTIDIYLDEIGLKCDDKDQKKELLAKIKEKSYAKHDLLTVEEFAELAHQLLDK